MNKAKYIKTYNGLIVVFSGGISHDKFNYLHPKSAGFIDIYSQDNKTIFYCYGKSESLNLSSDKNDSILAELQLGNDY